MLGSVVPRALAISAGSGQPDTAPLALATMEKGWQAECLDAKRFCHSGAKQRRKTGGFRGSRQMLSYWTLCITLPIVGHYDHE